jgi:hypothetical protein
MPGVLGPVVVDRARGATPRLALLVLPPGARGIGSDRGRDVTGPLVPRSVQDAGIVARLLDLADLERPTLAPAHRPEPDAINAPGAQSFRRNHLRVI